MTLNQLKQYLKGWFESSPFINSVIVSTKDDFNEVRNIDYPVAHIEYLNSNTNINYINYTFVITLADIQNDKHNHKNVDEIHNDATLIAQDFIDYHSENYELFELDENVQITPFEETTADRTAGITMAVRISIFRDVNTCIIPK
ncbi:hypothetical protein [Sphingobacterium mizutaii]|uniref:hypothetical protein n=1 Tax=Sphingobacterium mizutaii TaxID=1010 RepID=UPI001629AA2C|nr:hypothetical protein [Sphingobacterium mizutaii]